MANIYESKAERLHVLLDKARSDDGATVVIPELQRPYVWKPKQVILLIDSLIRGWPFGTLLMWKVNHDELAGIPHRAFWRTIDRTEDDAGTTALRRNPPASYHMVLDGQQRVQSLLLAFAGDNWGFKLEDREWVAELRDTRVRGRAPKHRHWSRASLCFDLDAFLREYSKDENVLAIDYREVISWAITDAADGQSKWPKPDNYAEPLVRAYDAPQNKRLIALNRLWEEAKPIENLKEKDFRKIVRNFLAQHQVDDARIDKLAEPLGEFMTTLRDVKLSKVTFLELVPFDSAYWNRDEYNDAIVNIFTRLNTAGRTLTREEITFAWLKQYWDEKKTNNRSAAKCFQDLQVELKSVGLSITMDDLVNSVSFMWSVFFNDGKILADRDLLRGDIIKPMAVSLSDSWSIVCESFVDIANSLNERALLDQVGSLNAITVLCAWTAQHRYWLKNNSLKAIEKDELEKKSREALNSHMDRWLICSTWAGRWAGGTNRFMAAVAKELTGDWVKVQTESSHNKIHDHLASRLEALVNGLCSDAENYVDNVNAASRDRVSIYQAVLWVWHRLDSKRWNNSQIALRMGKMKKTSHDVDHTVSHAYWSQKVGTTVPVGFSDVEEVVSVVNSLGNCALLEKTFNISKSTKTLAEFVSDIHEFKQGKVQPSDWSKSLLITEKMLDPSIGTVEQVIAEIGDRDTSMRSELKEFVLGKKSRIDL